MTAVSAHGILMSSYTEVLYEGAISSVGYQRYDLQNFYFSHGVGVGGGVFYTVTKISGVLLLEDGMHNYTIIHNLISTFLQTCIMCHFPYFLPLVGDMCSRGCGHAIKRL